jgi:hypothetical protein
MIIMNMESTFSYYNRIRLCSKVDERIIHCMNMNNYKYVCLLDESFILTPFVLTRHIYVLGTFGLDKYCLLKV